MRASEFICNLHVELIKLKGSSTLQVATYACEFRIANRFHRAHHSCACMQWRLSICLSIV